MFFYSLVDSCLGDILLVSDRNFLTGAYFLGQKNFPKINGHLLNTSDLAIFYNTKIQLEEYFNGKRKHFEIHYKLQGTILQKTVWEALTHIPAGKTVSYKEIASMIGKPQAIRATANAIGSNHINLIVPCHRAVGSNGKLTGYSAGIQIKKQLLSLEKQYYL